MQHVQTMQLLAKEPVSVPVATQKNICRYIVPCMIQKFYFIAIS